MGLFLRRLSVLAASTAGSLFGVAFISMVLLVAFAAMLFVFARLIFCLPSMIWNQAAGKFDR